MSLKSHRKGHWPGICKFGKLQSPIPLLKRLSYHIEVPALQFQNFAEFKNVKIENTGDTIHMTFPEACHCNCPKISGGGLVRDYTLNNIHFHWPAEHDIDGIKYELEMHFVFYADRYGTYEKACDHPYGIAIVAILLLQTSSTRSNNFKIIGEAAKHLARTPGRFIISKEGINLYHFLPYDHQLFYHYRGSLTVPHCREFVHWFVLKNTANISYLDLKNISHIYDTDGNMITRNNRELQDVNDRVVSIRRIW